MYAVLNSPLEKKDFYRNVKGLVIPMALQNLINVAVSAADVLMLGKVGETVLSGASLAGQVQFIMTLVFFGLTSGAAVLTAQYWGKGEARVIEKVIGISLLFSIIIALIFTAVAMIFPEQCLRVFSNEADVIHEGAKYLRVLSISFVFMAISMVYLNIMRSVERVIISTVVYSISLVCNVILNAILIFGLFGLPKLGIVGAAIATVTARFIELVIVLFYSKKKDLPVKLKFSDMFVSDSLLFKDFMHYSLPVMANELAWGGGVAMNSVILGHLGSSVVAANSVAQVARQLATVVAFGIANATAIMIGKVIGYGDEEKAKAYAHRFLKLTLFAGGCAAAIILAVTPVVLNVLNLSEQANEYLLIMMLVMSYFVFCQAYNTTIIVGICRAGGDTKFGLIMDVATMWGCSIAIGALCAFVFKLSVPIVYMVVMSDEVIKIAFSTYRYKSRKWLKNVTR